MFGQIPSGQFADGLVFLWRGIEADEAVDESYYGNHGTINGLTWGDGLVFPRVNNANVSIPPFQAYNYNWPGITMIIRMSCTMAAGGEHTLASNYSVSTGAFIFRIEPATKTLEFIAVQENNSDRVLNATDLIMTTNKIHIVAFTIRENDFMRCYVDGVESSNTTTFGIWDRSPILVPLEIGDTRHTAADPFGGTIYEVLWYNRQLSASEIEALYLDSDLPMPQEPIYVLPEEEEEFSVAVIEQDDEPMFGQIPSGQFADGLVGLYRFIEAEELVDESFYNNDGIIIGATWQGEDLFFDGTNDTVSLGIWPGYSIFTHVVWVKFDQAIGSIEMIASADSDQSGSLRAFQFRRIESGKLHGIVFTDGTKTITGNTTLTTGIWWHCVLVNDGMNMSIYVNGVSDATPVASGMVDSKAAEWVLGARAPNLGLGVISQELEGQERYYSSYDRALSASEIEALYLNENLPMTQEPIYVLPEEEEELNIAMIDQDDEPMFGQIPSGQFAEGLVFN